MERWSGRLQRRVPRIPDGGRYDRSGRCSYRHQDSAHRRGKLTTADTVLVRLGCPCEPSFGKRSRRVGNGGVRTRPRAYQILYDFKGEPDGKYPVAGLTYKDGALYGTTTVGGASNNGGTVFKFDLATGVETVLYSFTLGADGDGPYAPLLAIGDALYGTTEGGGSGYYGTVFKVDARTGRETVLHSFTGGKDGEYPFTAPLIEMGGLLYGSTMSTVFQIDPKTGLEKTLHGNLEEPNGLDARHGLLYGTSYVGGKSDDGEIFSLMP